MSNFNYVKAWYLFAKPTFEGMSYNQRNAQSKLIPLVGELNQGGDLNIPLSPAIIAIIEELTIKEIAELSNVSYFAGYWKPQLSEPLFSNTRGESWKISNCCDQILKTKLKLPRCLKVINGVLRVGISSKDYRLWEEFGMATEENINNFKTCGLFFTYNDFIISAEKLKGICGDLWQTDKIDELPNNEGYEKYVVRVLASY